MAANVSECQSFSRYLKQFKAGTLKPSANVRTKARKYVDIETKLIEYVDLRAQQFGRTKCGLNWLHMKEKCEKWAEAAGHEHFQVSAGWINDTLKRNNRVAVKLHGEAAELPEEECAKVMAAWQREKLNPFIEQFNLERDCIYNADQTGLFYQKLPNTLYVDKAKKKHSKGAKQLKDKTRATIMVCISADGRKCPLAMIGKPKMPECIKHLCNSKPPMAYKN